jgi:uncharacterized protein YlxW (UPF0749 family)
MSLLVDLSSHSLDPGYAEAAARRPSGTEPRHTGATLAVGVAVLMFLLVVAGVQAHVRAPLAAKNRADLAAGVQRQARAVDGLAREVDGLRAAVARLRDASLAGTAAGAALTRQIRAEELASGLVAVVGPGVRVTLDDAPVTDKGAKRNRVLDRDVQAAVNALWAAGAEAVAVNGQRLTAFSAIRQAGDAVLVDFAPLTPPYRIEAVGDPVRVEAAFADSREASRLRSYEQLYGLRFGYSRQDRLVLPAAAEDTLHYARPLPSSRGGAP